MKKKSIIGLFAFLLGFGATTTSCEDMLTPEFDRYAEGFTGRDTVNFYLGILSNVQDVIENNVILGEARADMVSPTDFVSDSLAKLVNFDQLPDADNGFLNRAAYYKVINQCNFYLAKVDTMAMKNNIYYMRKEFAQVQMIRAWVYMQLVQNYGSVPFITDPVDHAGTGWETNPPQGFADADNLLEKLLKNGLDKAYAFERTLGYPNYGTFKTGAVDIAHRATLFPGDIVLGDLYLLRGASKDDYAMAASYYYNYMKNNDLYAAAGSAASFNMSMVNSDKFYTPMASGWASSAMSLSSPNIITLVPSAANSSLGNTLTRVPQVFGFDPRSSNQTSSEGAVSGNISITANYKNRQLAPSEYFFKLNKHQVYSLPEESGGVQIDVLYPENLGDCRIDGHIKYVQTIAGRLPFVQKYGSRSNNNESNLGAFSFRYALTVDRANYLLLRYAEAINRAGFPRHAFSVLRNGLSTTNNPEFIYASSLDTVYYDHAKQLKYINIPVVREKSDGNNCIDMYELVAAENATANGINYLEPFEYEYAKGIHELGCGNFTDMDSLYNYDLTVLGIGYDKLDKLPEGMVKENLKGRMQLEAERKNASVETPTPEVSRYFVKAAADEEEEEEFNDSAYKVVNVMDSIRNDRLDYIPANLQLPGAPANLDAQIEAVETLIADEMALECAFEGHRYYDLYRIARHKNMANPGDGTDWFAWLVSRRNLALKPYEQPQTKGDLYGKLKDMNNWYLANPKY